MNDYMLRTPARTLLGMLVFLAAALASQAVLAQDSGCMDDLTGRENVCAANDVQITTLFNSEPGTCYRGDMVPLDLTAWLVATSQERYDIGIFLALDGGSAATGVCHHDYLPPPLAAGGTCSGSGDDCTKDADCPLNETCTGGYNPGSAEAPGGPFFDGEVGDPLDECGDLEQRVDTYYHILTPVVVECVDTDGDGYLDIGTAVSWDNKRDNTCEDAGDALPNTTAKCRYGRADIANVAVIPGAIQVQKSPQPGQVLEPGGWVTFTFTVENTTRTTVTLNSMVDSVYGPLDATDGDCALPQTLGPAAVYRCAISAEVTGEPGIYRNTVTVTGTDWYQATVTGTATAEVLLVALDPSLSVSKVADPTVVQEPGGEILYSVAVSNGSGESDPLTLTSLVDDLYGDLADPTNPAISTSTCQLVTIQPQQTYSCTFTAVVSGLVGSTIVDTVTVMAADEEGAEAQASDDATVTIVAEPPSTGMGMPAAVVAGGAAVLGIGLLAAGARLGRRRF